MIKSKHFMFIIVMMVIMLIVGNWVIPVQANTTGISTLVPTGTPFVTPNTPGNVASAEQQEELKSTVQSYFEIRYRALSVLYSDDFKKNGFGNLVSDRADAKAFLNAELGKLAVQIKHAELNHLRYVEYKYFLDFRNIVVDTQTQLATVSLIEEHDVIDQISMELTPENPFVSHSYNLEHTIVLRKEQGQWKIVSDDYMDYLWRMLRQTGKSTDDWLRNMKAAPRPTARSENETVTANALLEDASSHAYDRAGAVAYAYVHANEYNPNYPRYDIGDDALPWGDCINFVSQAIYEGGNVSMEIPSPLPPPSETGNGEEGWYLLNDMQRGRYWNDVGAFYNFVTQSYLFWQEGPEGSVVPYLNDIMLGDVIQYDWTGDGTWDHAVMVVNIVGTDVFVASHTPDGTGHYTAYFAPSYDPNLTQMRFIHIERSDGYPPVKAEIAAAADDASGDPGYPGQRTCNAFTTTDPNNNYFGSCIDRNTDILTGFRFTNIRIPRGATIKYAYVTFNVDNYGGNSADPPNYFPISLLAYGDASQLNFASYPLASRGISGPSVPWKIDGTVNGSAYDTWIWKQKRTAPNLTNIINPIISSGGWNSGNAFSIIFKNNPADGYNGTFNNHRRVSAFEGTAAGYYKTRLIAAYSGDESTLPPSVLSVTRASADPTNAASVNFTVTFSESVTGVDSSDFTLTTAGVSGAAIASVSGSGNTYTASVNTGSGSGTIRLDVGNNGTIKDAANNPLSGGFTGGEAYTIDKTAPTALSSLRASPNPTNAASVNFTVTFSESVTGVDSSDFTLTTAGVSGAAIASVSGSGNTYTVSVNTGSGSGTIRLDVGNNGTIKDAANNPLSGGFISGETYTIDKTEPMVISITRRSANPTTATSVEFRVTFSEAVTGVDVSDFTLSTTGVSGAIVTSVSGSGNTYIVTVNTGSGDGTIRLDVLNATATIADIVSNPLARSFTSGQIYTVIKISH